jgi:hypothetical protein
VVAVSLYIDLSSVAIPLCYHTRHRARIRLFKDPVLLVLFASKATLIIVFSAVFNVSKT